MAPFFIFNCLRWRDLDDPPRQIKWKQRQKISKVLRSRGPAIVQMYLYHGVKDASGFGLDITAAFADAGWRVDLADDDLIGEPEHERGFWIYGHSNRTNDETGDESARIRDVMLAAFTCAKIPVNVDRNVGLTTLGGQPSIVVGFNRNPNL